MMAVDINVVTAGATDTIYLAAGGKAVPANQFGNGVRCARPQPFADCMRLSPLARARCGLTRDVIAPLLTQGNAFGFEITP